MGSSMRLYVAIDGDDVGNALECMTLHDDIERLRVFSKKVRRSFSALEVEMADLFKADVIFTGGDNLLAGMEPDLWSRVLFEDVRSRFEGRTGCSISAGIGSSPREALIALHMAKCSGKNRTVSYEGLRND